MKQYIIDKKIIINYSIKCIKYSFINEIVDKKHQLVESIDDFKINFSPRFLESIFLSYPLQIDLQL